jgi:hypothetical protein
MTASRAAVVALLLVAEGAVIWTHPDEMRAVARLVYVAGWNILPTEGAEPPNRFAPRR